MYIYILYNIIIIIFFQILAEIFQDLLMNKEDYLRALRALFREICPVSLRHDLNFVAFCLGLMQKRSESKLTEIDQAFKVCVNFVSFLFSFFFFAVCMIIFLYIFIYSRPGLCVYIVLYS